MSPLKILYIRGMGSDTQPEHFKITQSYLKYLQARLEYLLDPYQVEIAKLDGSAQKNKWTKILEDLPLESYDVIVAHSSGVQAILTIAQNKKLKNLLLLGATMKHNHVRSELLTGWYDSPLDYEKIIENTKKIVICNGKKDPHINYAEAIELGALLNCRVYLYKNQKHLSEWTHPYLIDETELNRKNIIIKRLIEEMTQL